MPKTENLYSILEFEQMLIDYKKIKIEYFDGEIVMNTNIIDKHNAITTNIISKLKSFFKGSKYKVRSQQIEVILKDENEENRVFPDVFVVLDCEIQGDSYVKAPQIIFEVVSSESGYSDYIRKVKLYQKYGVLEYIVVHTCGDMIHYYMEKDTFKVSIDTNYKSKLYNNLELTINDIYEE